MRSATCTAPRNTEFSVQSFPGPTFYNTNTILYIISRYSYLLLSVSFINQFRFVSRCVDWCGSIPVWLPWRRHVSLPIISTVQIDVFLLLGGGGNFFYIRFSSSRDLSRALS